MLRFIAKRSTINLPAIENIRFLSQTGRLLEKPSPPAESEAKASESKASEATSKPAADGQLFKKRSHTLSNFDKYVLVSSGKFKSKAEVPDTVAFETLDRARDKWRVKMCIYMMLASVVICIIQVIRGKRAAERGESVVNRNMEWHRQYNEAAATKENK